MLTTFLAVLPVFAIIGTGLLAGRFGWLGPAAVTELNRFTVQLALPALLFEVMATADWRTLWDPGFVAAFSLGSAVLFIGTILARRRRLPTLADASIEGLGAGYANVGYIGFPLCDAVFGHDSFGLVTLSAILVTSVLFGAAVVLVELGIRDAAGTARTRTLVLSLLQNPILVAPALGAALSGLGIPLPEAILRFIHLVGAAASPCALVALGLFLSASRATPGRPALPVALAALKLFGQPAVTALFAYLFRLQPHTAAVCILLSALPTGTGAFMLAEKYQRPAIVTSRTILFSTVASVFTLTAILLVLGR